MIFQCTDWTAVSLDDASERTGNSKLRVLRCAREAGLTLPEGGVLLRAPGGEFQLNSTDLSYPEECKPWILSLSKMGNRRLILRSLLCGNERIWRAVSVCENSLGIALSGLLAQFPDTGAILVQASWPGRLKGNARIVTMVSCFVGTSDRFDVCYQRNTLGSVNVFDSADCEWGGVVRAYRLLEQAIGTCSQVTFGLIQGTITVLSVHRGALQLEDHAEAAVRLAKDKIVSHGKAIAVVSSVLNTENDRFCVDKAQVASSGAKGRSLGQSWATGRATFSAEGQARFITDGDEMILVRSILRTEDCHLLRNVSGVVSIADGLSSHFALYANSLGIACLVDLEGAAVNMDIGALLLDDVTITEGDWITIDEKTGTLFRGRAHPVGEGSKIPVEVLGWANEMRMQTLFVNCEEGQDADIALTMGADGVGLCRSERHFLSSKETFDTFQRVVCSSDENVRVESTKVICDSLGNALEQLLKAARGKRVNYRLLDPAEDILAGVTSYIHDGSASTIGIGCDLCLQQIIPRGGAFRSTFSTLYKGQIEQAISAARNVADRANCRVDLAIIVPMVSDIEEYEYWERFIRHKAGPITAKLEPLLSIRVGAMVETPRAALLAGELARSSDVLLVGTNDLTSWVWGLNRVGGQSSMPGISDPFKKFDAHGVGALVSLAVAKAHDANPDIGITICGGHASDIGNIDRLIKTGADRLSCSLEAFPRIALELAVHSEMATGGCRPGLPSQSTATAVFQHTLTSALQLKTVGQNDETATQYNLLTNWAKEIALDQCFEWTGVWKFFKRDLVDRWFGKREAKRFMPRWRVQDLLEYALRISMWSKTRIRYSVFRPEIACRSQSALLPNPSTEAEWCSVLERLDAGLPVEIFPQQPIDRIAFRAVLRSMTMFVEGAAGQAIDVFWKSPVQLASFTFNGWDRSFDCSVHNEWFVLLFKSHIIQFYSRVQSLRDYLGADWVSLEGYAGPSAFDPLFVADIDLPLDSVLLKNPSVE